MHYYTIEPLGIRYYVTADKNTIIENLDPVRSYHFGPIPRPTAYKFFDANDIEAKDITELDTEPDRKNLADVRRIFYRSGNVSLKWHEGTIDLVLFPSINGKKTLFIELTLAEGQRNANFYIYDEMPSEEEITDRINYVYSGLYWDMFNRTDSLDPEGPAPKPNDLTISKEWKAL